MDKDSLKKIISHSKEYGFIFPSSEIYEGLNAIYYYAHNGALLKNNIREYWWRSMVQLNENIVGIDSAIFMHPKTWVASGHVDAFNDPLIDNKDSKKRYRSDVLIEEFIEKLNSKIQKEVQKAEKRFKEKFCFFTKKRGNGKLIWFHGASVGELKSIIPLLEMLEKEKYIQYETSSFSKKGYESKHNSGYWKRKKYLGIGPSAHSFNGEFRYWNISDNKKYISSLNKINQIPPGSIMRISKNIRKKFWWHLPSKKESLKSESKNWEVGKMYGYQWVKWEKYIEDQKAEGINVTD